MYHRIPHDHLQFLFNVIKDRPDAYLEELQLQLMEETGNEVSTATIWRALTKGGLTMKKVRPFGSHRSS
jgi:transposase